MNCDLRFELWVPRYENLLEIFRLFLVNIVQLPFQQNSITQSQLWLQYKRTCFDKNSRNLRGWWTHIVDSVRIVCIARTLFTGILLLTLLAHSKHVVTTLFITFIRFFVSLMTWSTLTNVAALPTVGSLTVNCKVWTYVGTLSKWSNNSFLFCPAGTCESEKIVDFS